MYLPHLFYTYFLVLPISWNIILQPSLKSTRVIHALSFGMGHKKMGLRGYLWSLFWVTHLGHEAQRSLTSVKHKFESKERGHRRSTEKRWTLCCGAFARRMLPDLEDTKSGHALGRRMAAREANGTGPAGNLRRSSRLLRGSSSILRLQGLPAATFKGSKVN